MRKSENLFLMEIYRWVSQSRKDDFYIQYNSNSLIGWRRITLALFTCHATNLLRNGMFFVCPGLPAGVSVQRTFVKKGSQWMLEAFAKRDYNFLSVPCFYFFYQATLYVERIWNVELDNQDLFYLSSSESFDTLDTSNWKHILLTIAYHWSDAIWG